MESVTPRLAALLPIKEHSERIADKNFSHLAGKPLFRWILDTLLSIDAIDEIVINTDARRRLEEDGLSDTARVRIRDRVPELCGDLVSMNLVLADDIASVPADVYLMTHATNPLLRAETIEAAVAAYFAATAAGSADSLFSVSRFQSRFYAASGEPINHDPTKLIRTQDLEPWFEENSCLYLFTAESFRRTGARIGVRPTMYETPRRESVDIDDLESWELAEALARGMDR